MKILRKLKKNGNCITKDNNIKVRETTEYFGISKEELSKIIKEKGMTVEEYKIRSEGGKVIFFDTEVDWLKNKKEYLAWVKNYHPELSYHVLLRTVNDKIVSIYW